MSDPVCTCPEWVRQCEPDCPTSKWSKRIAELRAQNDVLKQECDELRAGWRHEILEKGRAWQEAADCRAMLVEILASAHPHPREHPTMHAAWTKARALLAKEQA